ncbi:bifunctional DNA-formamidopyrimidine glycosylase/DNA-(apurinic or apyrimidinic site) lyase [Stieleria sp. JC731]|uniref:bifunctional DNA-formamidopyrimidine glycosylase/DNA-(apurinic or apyrimidinic site) lyase n=1 Tax=Pirellulaceae TaxID=2691357 RepID=UPI001E444F58|nr:bifunctional DNA-formamidopyrimidine glycosylase/DNA-(apurinic or apyrimidinic site) lyase [Stieleria sp. JC731]MCC9599816.1 bifunctional DNA-formamidopyrimidine glycosylase/DNA-(apurinic or apyrimidinic site) lyase [Stieleria sp. JC731]
MPELPEVETMRRGVMPIVGQRIVAAECPPCQRRPILMEPGIGTINRRLRDREICGIERLGKRVIIVLDDGQSIVIEPRMTGLVLLADPPTTDHLRFRMKLTGEIHPELLFWDRRGLGTLRLLQPGQLEQQVRAKLGQDALQIDAESLRDQLKSSRRVIKVALLDQRAVAGIGNLYAAEILFVAGVDPRTRCDQLSMPQWQRIVVATGLVLHEAIAHEGSTLSDGTYRNALNQSGGYQNYHRVYDRADQPCSRCQLGTIRRIVQAQRSTFFCPVCQKKSGLHPTVEKIEVSSGGG